jgi:UDP-glucose 4-epimerase
VPRRISGTEVFNIASGVETSLLKLAQSLATAMVRHEIDPHFAPERSVNPVPRRLASTAKAERLLGLRATIPLEEGLHEIVDLWRVERHSLPTSAGLEPVAP